MNVLYNKIWDLIIIIYVARRLVNAWNDDFDQNSNVVILAIQEENMGEQMFPLQAPHRRFPHELDAPPHTNFSINSFCPEKTSL